MKAINFSLPDQQGQTRTLEDFRGSYVVLYFYPKDFTSGCTTEACDFRDNLEGLTAQGAVVIGVSKDTPESHSKFNAKHSLGFVLLSDPSLELAKAYEAFGTKNMYGKKVEGVIRSTFIIGPDGELLEAMRGVKVAGHVDRIREKLAKLKATPS
jgi:peroxiredoxin Q/BCP